MNASCAENDDHLELDLAVANGDQDDAEDRQAERSRDDVVEVVAIGRPPALRAASANGRATPAMNMNAGWIRSQKNETVPGHVIEPARTRPRWCIVLERREAEAF